MNNFIESKSDSNQDQTMMKLTPEDMIRRFFLDQSRNDREIHRIKIVKAIAYHDTNLKSNSEHIKFICSFDDDQYE